MTVPNTANPVDGGNINATSGSPNHWQTVIDDMADYDTVGRGAGPNWHATQASHDHEWAHWNEDYVQDALQSAGRWTDVNRSIDAVTVPKASAADAAAARTALEPEVNRLFRAFVAAVTVRWNHLIGTLDKPGKGGRGYAAGTRVLSGLITRVRTYATSKGWTGGGHAGTGAVAGAVVGGLVGGAVGALVGGAIGGIVGSLF